MAIKDGEVLHHLKRFQDPYCAKDLVERGSVKQLAINDAEVLVSIALGYAAASEQQSLEAAIEAHLCQHPAIKSSQVQISSGITAHKVQPKVEPNYRIKNIIAVASGKGGVGKSTVSVNLALALAKEGARVGLLDADIYGPSGPMMLGIAESVRPEFTDEKHFKPIEALGIQSTSMGYMVTDKTPMVWRGPMVSGALLQLYSQCLWNQLDYLIIDMPPGTGDIQLTLAQKIPVTGAVIVTTPQDIALLDAKKGIEMFAKTQIPVLGLVENMAMHHCSQCGHAEAIFGAGGGETLASDYNVPLLGQLPLDKVTREGMDTGKPPVQFDPSSPMAQQMQLIAKRVGGEIAAIPELETQGTVQMIVTDR